VTHDTAYMFTQNTFSDKSKLKTHLV
jgi:hypothetical protein